MEGGKMVMTKSLVADNGRSIYETATMVANLPDALVPVPDLHKNGSVSPSSNTDASLPNSPILNLDRGDKMMLEAYWRKMSEECRVEIKGWEFLSYGSDWEGVCYFMLPELRDAIKRLHALVGNAETDDRHIVVGNGCTQLYQASLIALSSSSFSSSDYPVNVVAAAPYYSGYPYETDMVRSSLYKWSGDAKEYDKNEAYIEIVTSPNNPDGGIRKPVVNKCGCESKLIHDLVFYWPHYTPITHKAKHDLMLFSFSKLTGHSGSRIGWAIVKDLDIARKMSKFIEMNSIGVSKEAQTRATKIIQVLCDSYQDLRFDGFKESELFFEYSRHLLKERWQKLREVINKNGDFVLPNFSHRDYCNFSNQSSESLSVYAWLMCKKDEDCGSYVEKKLRVIARRGYRFGSDPKYARIDMLISEDDFNELLERLSNVKDISH